MYYAYFELDPQSKLIFEHLTGYGGKQVLPVSAIAARFGISASQVNAVKKKIQERLKEVGGA